MRHFQGIIRNLVFSSLWVSFVITALAWMGQWWFKEYSIPRLVLVFALCLAGYNFIRVVGGYLHKFKSESERQSWIYKQRKVLMGLIGLCLPIILFLIIQEKLWLEPFTYWIPALTLGYALPFWKGKTRLRDLPFLKVFLIAFVWASVVCFLGIPGFRLQGIQFLFFGQIFFYTLGLTIPFDIRDIQRDPQDLRTIPQWAGVKPAKRIAQACLILFEVGLWLQLVIFKNLKLIPFIVLMISNKALLGLIYWSEEEKDEMYFSFWIEGAPILGVMGIVFWELIR